MQKQIAALLTLLVLPLLTVANQQYHFFWDREPDLKGNIKTLITKSYKLNSKNKESLQWTITEEFDLNGKKTSALSLLPSGRLDYKWTASYDSQNRIAELSETHPNGSTSQTIFDYQHFPAKVILKVTQKNPDDYGEGICIYDSNGLMVEHNSYDKSGKATNKSTYEYDDKGRLKKFTDNEPGKHFSGFTYKYNEAGKLKERQFFVNQVLEEEEKTVYKYDEAGNLFREETYDKRGTLLEVNTISYKFDSVGNWIKKTETKEDLEWKRVTTWITYQEITYQD